MGKNERNFWLNAIMIAVVLTTTITGLLLWLIIPHTVEGSCLGLTRRVWLAVHMASGLLLLAGVIVHIVWHWQWLRALRGRPLRDMPEKVRANRVVDRMVWIMFITTNAFGLIGWALHFDDVPYVVNVVDRLHVAAGVAWAVFLTAHLALHWKWALSATRRYVQTGLTAS